MFNKYNEHLPRGVVLHERLVVGKRVVVEEESRRDVERDEHVDGVVLVRRQDEEDAEHVHHPRQDVQQVQVTGCIWKTWHTEY